MSADAAGHAIDFIDNAELRDAGAELFDDPGHVDAEDGRERMARMRRFALGDLEVERIDRARLDPHEHLSRCWARTGNVCELQRRARFFPE